MKMLEYIELLIEYSYRTSKHTFEISFIYFCYCLLLL